MNALKNREIVYLLIVSLIIMFSVITTIKKLHVSGYAEYMIDTEVRANAAITQDKKIAQKYIRAYTTSLYDSPDSQKSSVIRVTAFIGSIAILRAINIIAILPYLTVLILGFGSQGYVHRRVKLLEFKMESPIWFHYIQRFYFVGYISVLSWYLLSPSFISPLTPILLLIVITSTTSYVVMANLPIGHI